MTHCSTTNLAGSLILFGFFAFTLALLMIPNYFSFAELSDVTLGLAGANVKGKFSSYSELIDECSPTHILADVCDALSQLATAGSAFQAMLILDIFILAVFALEVVALQCILRRLLTDLIRGLPPRPMYMALGRLVIALRFVFLLHPVALFLGLALWAGLSEVSEIDESVELGPGLILSCIGSFLALFAAALYGYYLSSSKRCNIMYLLDNMLKSEEATSKRSYKQSCKADVELVDISIIV